MQTCQGPVQKRSADLVGRRHETRALRQRQDVLRRFARTSHAISLQWMNRTVAIESNNSSLLDLCWKFFERYQQGTTGEIAFKWRIFCERDEVLTTTAVPVSAFSEMGLRYASIGQRGFLAADLSKREGVAFIPEVFLEDDAMLHTRHPLDALFCLTASSLGLVSLSGGCVANGERGVMVFGPPNSGKTTACYLAAQSGLEFLADQMLFLDLRRELSAWGDSLNAVFRPSTLEFLPELQITGFHSNYGGVSFLYYDKSHLQSPKARPVAPACSLFLLRCSEGAPQLRNMSPDEIVSRLRECLLFEEDASFDQQIDAALQAAATKPGYELRYPRDPKIAADLVREVLRC